MTELVKLPAGLKKRVLSLKQKRQHKFQVGEWGEQQAIKYLATSNIKFLASNIRFKHKEVDIIGFDQVNQELVLIEVKTRSSSRYGHPSRAVDYKKINSLKYLAKTICRTLKYTGDYRFDILTVLPGKIDHYQNVTW